MAVRVDKWLWAVRVYKTRSAANDACGSNRVLVNGEPAKPATKVDVGDTVEARRKDRVIVYRVVQPLEKRVGATPAAEAVEDLSPPMPRRREADGPAAEAVAGVRDRGTGRPTKRDRRRIERLRGRP
jgi:ribosome-associated heat shock protein Hsp15